MDVKNFLGLAVIQFLFVGSWGTLLNASSGRTVINV